MTDIQKCEETGKEKGTISTYHWKYAQWNADLEKENIRNRFPLLALLQQNLESYMLLLEQEKANIKTERAQIEEEDEQESHKAKMCEQ
ncbi:hypothetical protein Tco_0926568 [Tanacetum coccineum]|uniref:Uncharacterized protein n=1 Tax=Tanacetum coccineum TaxID=301880 RepID=A0ABQ5DGG0_9ASTR